jgi:hypothetical protein
MRLPRQAMIASFFRLRIATVTTAASRRPCARASSWLKCCAISTPPSRGTP